MTTNNSTELPAAAVTNGEGSTGVVITMATDAVTSAPDGCDSCHQLQQQVIAYKKEQAFYSDLKKKIALTDALIRRYTTKCQEYDLQQRKVEELTRKLASSKRDCKLLEEQLAKTLKEIIPWKREKTKFMDEYENNKRKLAAAQDALMANHAGTQQYRIQINELEKTLTMQKKEAAEAKIKVKNLQAILDKRKFNSEDHKNEIAQVKKETRTMATSLEKAKATILRLRTRLIEHNISVPRMAPQFLPKKAGDVKEMADNSDVSMESVSDVDDDVNTQKKPETPVNIQEEHDTPYGRKIQSILERRNAANGPLPLTRKTGVIGQKVKQESSSEDNLSGSEMMSHVADEIDAQLKLTESQGDSKPHQEDTKNTSALRGKTLDMQTRSLRVGRKFQTSRKTASTNARPVMKEIRGTGTKRGIRKNESEKKVVDVAKPNTNVGSQRQQPAGKAENIKQCDRLTSTTDMDSSDDDEAKASIAFRTRTRTQSQSGHSSTEKSPENKSTVSKSNKTTKANKTTRFVKSKKSFSRRQSTREHLSKKNVSVKKNETSTDSDTSNDEGGKSRKSPPRTRSQSQSGTSGSEKTPSSNSKGPMQKNMKASATLSDTSEEETGKTKKVIRRGKVNNSHEKKIPNDEKVPVKTNIKTTLSGTSDEDEAETCAGKNNDKAPGKDEAFLSDSSDDDWQANEQEGSATSNKPSTRKEASKKELESDEVARNSAQDKKSQALEMLPRQRRNTDTEFETKRYPRRSKRVPKRCKDETTEDKDETTEDEDVQTRAFYSDGDKPLNTHNRQKYDFRKHVKKAKKLNDSSDESEDEQTKESEKCARSDPTSIFDEEEESTSDSKHGVPSEREKLTTSLSPTESANDNKQSNLSVLLKIPSSPPIRAENLALSPDDSAFRKKFLKPISPVRSSPRKKLSSSSSSGDDTPTGDTRTNPFFPVRSTRSSIQNLSASFESVRGSSLESSFQESLEGEAGCSGLQTRSAAKAKPDVDSTDVNGADVQTRNSSSLESSHQHSSGNDASCSELQRRSAVETKLDVTNTEIETKMQSQSSDDSANDIPLDIEKGNQNNNELAQNQVKNNDDEADVFPRIVRSRRPDSRSSEEEKSETSAEKNQNNEDVQNVAQTGETSVESNTKVKEEVQFAEPISTRSFYNRRRTRSMSSTSSCSDVSNQSDFVEQQSSLESTTDSNSVEAPKRRTRSMSARRQDPPKQVRITRSMSEPRKADLKKMKKESVNEQVDLKKIKKEFDDEKTDLKKKSKEFNGKKTDMKNTSKDFDGEKADLRKVNKELNSENVDFNKDSNGKPKKKPLNPAPGKRITRLQALNQNVENSTTNAGQSGSNTSNARPREDCNNLEDGNKNKRNLNTKRTRSKNEDNSGRDGKVVKKLKNAQSEGTCSFKNRAGNASNHDDNEHEELGDQSALARSNTPSPGLNAPDPPILEPFQNYALPQGRVSPLPQLFEERDAHRHMSPVSPLPEPFQNFDGERSLSPLPISPSETPPVMERPLSALSLPDLPPMPPLVTPLPPSPLRSLLTRSTSRLSNQVRMVSPLTTPPPRAISPLPTPPMPDAISPLKDDDSMDTVQQRLNLIPSPRNFHAVAPRHAVAVPPHPTGHLFQAARCLTDNFTEEDGEIAGPSGINTVAKKGSRAGGKVPSSKDNDNSGNHVKVPLSKDSEMSDDTGQVPSSEDNRMSFDTGDVPSSQINQRLSNTSASNYDVKNADAIIEASAEQDMSVIQSQGDGSPDMKANDADMLSDEGQVTERNISPIEESDSLNNKDENKNHKRVKTEMDDTSKEDVQEQNKSWKKKDAENKQENAADEVYTEKKNNQNTTNALPTMHCHDVKRDENADQENVKVGGEQGKKRSGKGARKGKQAKGSTNSVKKDKSDETSGTVLVQSCHKGTDIKDDENADQENVGDEQGKKRRRKGVGKDEQAKGSNNSVKKDKSDETVGTVLVKSCHKGTDIKHDEHADQENVGDEQGKNRRGKGTGKNVQAKGSNNSVKKDKSDETSGTVTVKSCHKGTDIKHDEHADQENVGDEQGKKRRGKGAGKNERAKRRHQLSYAVNDKDTDEETVDAEKEGGDDGERGKKRGNARKHKQVKDSVNKESANVDISTKDGDENDVDPIPLIMTRGRRRISHIKKDGKSADGLPQKRCTRSMRHTSSSEDKDVPKEGLDKCVKPEERTKEDGGVTPGMRSRKRTNSGKDETKESNIDEDVVKCVKPDKVKKEKMGKSAIKPAKISRKKPETNQDLLEVLEKQGVVTTTEMRVSGFKRSRSWQRRSSEVNKAQIDNAAATEVKPKETSSLFPSAEMSALKVTSMSPGTGGHSGRTKEGDDVASDMKVINSSSVVTKAEKSASAIKVTSHLMDESSPSTAAGISPVASTNQTISPPKDSNFRMKRGKGALNSSEKSSCKSVKEETLQPSMKHSVTPVNESNKQWGSVQSSSTSDTNSSSVVEGQSISVSTQLNRSDTVSATVHGGAISTVKQSTTLQNNSNSSSRCQQSSTSTSKATGSSASHSPGISATNLPNVSQGQAEVKPSETDPATPQATTTAQKSANKIGSLWGNIAKDHKKSEKAMQKEATEVWKSLTEKNTMCKTAHSGNKRMGAISDDDKTGNRSEEQRKQGGRGVAAAWGDFTVSGEDQQEASRRRKKQMPDKIAAKQKKFKESDTPSTTMPYTKPMREEQNKVNDGHVQDTLKMIAKYRMGTNATRLAKRIVYNFQFNAIDLLPVVFARCVAGNTSKEPVLTPIEDKIITAVVDWTKKNNCTTLIDFLLAYLRQVIDMPTLMSGYKIKITPQKKFAINSTLCRLYTILCFETDNLQCARVFVYDLLRNEYACLERLLVAVASSWPTVLYKQESIQASPVGSVIEAVVMQRLSIMPEEEMTQKALIAMCGWKEHQADTITNITHQLVAMVQDAIYTQLINENDPNPTLSQMAFELSKAMELLAVVMGWEWTNDVLIREHLWPVLKKWTVGLRSENGIKNGSACLVMKIIANVGVLGLKKNKQSVSEVMKMLLAVLQQPSNIIPLCVQLYTTDAVLQLSAAKPSLSHPVLQKWCSNAGQAIPASLTDRIQVLGSWLTNTNQRQMDKSKH
ncbi:uncharacterized protein [Amphiura filiformis]|uniref:uncharacterized protein n=1 Tax=Amphiura filiformis TaxID=82378 RepID=UPI003B2101A6